MALSRKLALKRMTGLAAQIEEHLEKIVEDPSRREVRHCVHEVQAWIEQIEALLDHVGARTAAEWQARIDEWRERLGG